MIFANFADAGDLFAEQSLRIGFHRASFHEYSREDLEISVKILTEEMGKEIGIQTSVLIYEDIKLMRTDFEQGKINLIFASPLLIATKFDSTLLADGFKMVPAGRNIDRLVVLTRKNEGMDDFKSLRSKKLGLVENDPAADLYINFLSQTNFKKDYHDTFTEIPREKKSHQVILKLFFGQADVVCVYDNFYQITTELNPQILSKTQIIAHIDGILQGAGFFHKNVDPVFRDRVIAEATQLNTYVRGQQFLEIFKDDKALRITPAELAMTRQLYSDYQRLRKTK
jgi:ABC-type phosphate/phosphonate transport system substrate-binding protein